MAAAIGEYVIAICTVKPASASEAITFKSESKTPSRFRVQAGRHARFPRFCTTRRASAGDAQTTRRSTSSRPLAQCSGWALFAPYRSGTGARAAMPGRK